MFLSHRLKYYADEEERAADDAALRTLPVERRQSAVSALEKLREVRGSPKAFFSGESSMAARINRLAEAGSGSSSVKTKVEAAPQSEAVLLSGAPPRPLENRPLAAPAEEKPAAEPLVTEPVATQVEAAPAREKTVAKPQPQQRPPSKADMERQSPAAPKRESVDTGVPVKGGWYVQVAADTSELDALSRANFLKSVSLPVRVQPVTVADVKYYRVIVGPYNSRATAQDTADKIVQYQVSKGTPFVREVK